MVKRFQIGQASPAGVGILPAAGKTPAFQTQGKLYVCHNRLDTTTVIPAKATNPNCTFEPLKTKMHWIPAFAGMAIVFRLPK